MTEKVCDCGTDDESIHATTCAVYVAPENPVCSCAEACGVETQNFWCDVCGFDYTACTGTDTAVAYAEGDKVSVTINGETTYYTSIKDAVAKANESGNATITLLQDTTTGERLDITNSATLDLNGNTLSCTAYFADDYETMVAITTNNTKLTIIDSVGGGKLDGTGTDYALMLGEPGAYTARSASAYIDGSTVSGSVKTVSGTSMTVSGGTVESNSVVATIDMTNATTLNVFNSQILNTHSSSTAPAIDNSGTLTITDSTVSGSIGVDNRGTANISGNTNITGTVCSVKSRVESQDSTLTITGGNYTGGINISGGTATISGGSYTGDIVVSGGTATISGGTITASSAENSVEVFDSAELTISGGTFSATAGGPWATGVYVHDGGTVKITGGTITSTAYGVYNERGSATITGGSISGGTVDLYVGGSDSILNLTLDEGKTVGATFPGGITAEGITLTELLATDTAYWGEVDGKDTMLTVADDVTSITDNGDITIRAICDHKDVKLDYITTETTHTPVCSVCNWTGDATEHTGGTATCQAPAVCEACGVSYGDKDANIHTPTEGTIFTDNGDGTHSYTCACGAAVAEVPHTLDVTTGKCGACGADMTVVATVTDGTNTYYAADAATLNQAVTAILETGSSTFTVELPADAEAGMITAIRRAICDTEGVADGSIHLTLKGVTSIPGTTNWDGVAFGPGDIYDEAGKIVDQELVTQLASINLPDVTEIGARAFYFCENLVTVSAPKAQTIGAQAFGYTALTSVEFPELTTIPTDMFSGTWTLSSAKFPKVTTIEQGGLLVGAKFTPENNPTPFPLELTAEGDITFNGSYHFNIAERNYTGKVDLVLCCDKKEAVTFHDDGTATWQVREDLSYTFKSITFKHSYVNSKCTACGEDCAHTGGTATCTTLAVCEACGVSYGAVDTNNHDSSVECENGFCENGCYEPATDYNADGVYEIYNAGQLFWFAQQVNVKGNREIKGVLTADIDLENKPWTPIGSTGEENNNFRGVFDGQNHTIRGLYVEGSENGVGFFGEVRTGTVKNFRIYGNVVVNTEVDYVGGVIGSICGVNGETSIEERNGAIIQNITSFVNVTAKAHGIGMIGGFVGYANHQSLIEKCAWYGTFDAGEYRVDSGAGGFIGKIQENTGEVTIRNCGAYGTIKTNYAGDYNNTATIYMGGFLSFSNTGAKTTIEDCLFAGRFERGENLTDEARLGAFGTLRSVNAIKNCYYLGDDGLEAVHSDSDLKPGSDNVEITSVTGEDLRGEMLAVWARLGEYWMQDVHYPIPKDTKAHSDSATYTYTDNGDGTHKKTCNECGYVEEVKEEHYVDPTTTTYTDNGNGTHSFKCAKCDAAITENHSFTDGTCTACGINLFTVSGSTLTIDGTLGGKTEATEEDVTAMAELLRSYIENGMTTIIVTGSQPAKLLKDGYLIPVVSLAFEQLTYDYLDEKIDSYWGTVDLIYQDVTEIVEYEFYVCDVLKSITLPKVTTVGDRGFWACYYLETLTFGSVVTAINDNSGEVFYDLGYEIDGCNLALNCGQLQAATEYQPNLNTKTWWKDNEWKSITLTHTEGTAATCIAQAVCSVCGESYGEVGGHSPDAAGYTVNADGTHSYTCSSCGNLFTESHTFTDGACTGCGVIGGYCGEEGNEQGVWWTFAGGTLTVSGTGAMADQFDNYDNRPWEAYVDQITTIVVNDGITSIGEAAFLSFQQLTTAKLPDSLTTISRIAFGGCRALKTVNLPASLKTIEGWAFQQCYALESVTLPEGLTTVDMYAFTECINLKSVSVPASVTTIGERAFGLCPATITVAEDNLNYSSDEHGVLFDKNKTTLMYCRPNIEVETYTIPSTVTEICKSAFYGCKNLATITIPEGVTTIGESAFSECTALTTVTIPAGVTTIEVNTFYDCTALTAVTIPAGVTTINQWAFSACTALTTVTIPASVTSIAYNAFSNCNALATVNVPCTWDDSLYTFDESVTVNKVHNWTNGTCTVCGEPCDHKDSTHTTATDNGDGTHSFECSVCVNTVIEDHTGGTATCTTLAVCEACGASYGELAAHTPDAGGKCTVDGCGYQYPAKVGDTFYETIHKALRAAEENSGCILTLLDDITLTSMSSTASYTNQGTFILDLNGKTLSSNKGTLNVLGSADLTIRDSAGGGKIISTYSNAIYQTGGKVTIESGSFEGTLDGVFLSGSSTLTVKGGTFVGGRAMITGFGSDCVIDLTAIDPTGFTLKNNGSGTFAPKLPEGYGMVDSDGKLLTSLSAEQSATVHKHEYKYTDIGDGKHQQACSCGLTTGEPAAHSTTADGDSAADCNSKAYYSVCESYYGDVDKTNHDSSVEYENGFCKNGCYEPATLNAEGFYEIFNAGQLYWFAQQVNIAGNTTANGKLMADIDLENSTWYPIGLYNDIAEANGSPVQKQYAGTFDGNNHTVSNFTAIGNGSQGLFGYCNENQTQIKNLGVINATVSGWNAGAVAGYCANLTNCYAVGCTITGASDVNTQAVTISSVGGNNGPTVITNCWAYNCKLIVGEGEANYVMHPVGGIRASNNSVNIVQNCYYGEIVTDAEFTSTTGAVEKTEAQFASGEVAYLLGTAWGQTIGTDSYPVLGGKIVYEIKVCEKSAYSNTYGDVPHKFDENGFCTATPGEIHYQPALDSDSDGFFEIGNAGQLYWFAAQVNGGNTAINAILTKDITVNKNVLNEDGTLNGDGSNFRVWTPIGNYDYPYTGTFNGGGKTVSGLYFNDRSVSDVGLFGYVSSGTIKHVGVINSYFNGLNHVGGVAGLSGGIVKNCYNTSTVSGSLSGGLVGISFGTVENCYNTGTVSGNMKVEVIVGSPLGKVVNCFNLDTCALTYVGTNKTAEQFASGEVAYLLNGSTSEGTLIWGQTIGTDDTPNFTGGTVYQVTNCKGETLYSNANENVGHSYGAPVYTWTEDSTTLTATLTCTVCSQDTEGHTLTGSTTDVDVEISSDGFTTTYTATVTLDGKDYTDSKVVSNEVTSVNITWGSMNFTYTDGSGWNNPDTAWVQVANTGNTAVSVAYTYDTERTDIAGSFFDGTSTVTAPVAIDAAGSKQIWLRLDGKPNSILSNTTIGSVKLTIE